MTFSAERTCWAGAGLALDTIEALTLIAEESDRRGGDSRPELDPRDPWSWPLVLDDVGYQDLAERVRLLNVAGA